MVSGAVLGTVAFQTDGEGDLFTAAESFTLGAIVGGGLGLIAGTFIAIGNTADEWETVPVAATQNGSRTKPALCMMPNARGVTLGVGVRF